MSDDLINARFQASLDELDFEEPIPPVREDDRELTTAFSQAGWAAFRSSMTKPHLALVDPQDEGAIDDFLGALGAGKPAARSAEEEDDTHHYYGAWYGGKASAGGHPATGASHGYTGPAKAHSQVSHGQPVGGTPAHAGPVPAHIAAFEAGILKKNPKIEWGMVWDKDGNPVYPQAAVRGTAGYIRWRITADQRAKWKGGTLTHNHPYSGASATAPTTLSVTDIMSGLQGGLGSIRAFAPNGSMELINHGFTGSISELKGRLDAGVRELKKAIPKSITSSAQLDAINVAWLTGHYDVIKRVIGDTPGLEIVTTP